MAKEPIVLSIFDLFKSGPGPSSSHTMGPMWAGFAFMREASDRRMSACEGGDRLRVRLLGSLGATGRGHATDRAVLAGLMGYRPESCAPDVLDGLLTEPGQSHVVRIGERSINMGAEAFEWAPDAAPMAHPCALSIAWLAGDRVCLERTYYSTGGGFIEWEGRPIEPRGEPVYPFSGAEDVRRLLSERDVRLDELMIENEMAITGVDETTVYRRLEELAAEMDACVERGLHAEGLLPGALKVHRKAALLARRAERLGDEDGAFMMRMAAYAFAVAEENAAGHRVVTAPTCGSAGVLPSILRVLKDKRRVPARRIVERALPAAALIGMLVKHNATLSGAEAGCQAEIGTASAMAAAALAATEHDDIRVIENAAEIALEHHLGMTCDPVGGYVQIPCIERNAMGAVKAYLAGLIAGEETVRFHRVNLDRAIRAMYETGRDLQAKYRETGQGGLARWVH